LRIYRLSEGKRWIETVDQNKKLVFRTVSEELDITVLEQLVFALFDHL
jgi:hypothetical protein